MNLPPLPKVPEWFGAASRDIETDVKNYARQAQREAVAAAVPGWMPIETAPKNCRILIGRVGHPWAFSARWNERKEYWSTGQTPMDFFAEPTHWMPLPPPPKVKP